MVILSQISNERVKNMKATSEVQQGDTIILWNGEIGTVKNIRTEKVWNKVSLLPVNILQVRTFTGLEEVTNDDVVGVF